MISRVTVTIASPSLDAPRPAATVGSAAPSRTHVLQPGRKIPSVAGAGPAAPPAKKRVPGRFAGSFVILDGFFDPLSPREAGSDDR